MSNGNVPEWAVKAAEELKRRFRISAKAPLKGFEPTAAVIAEAIASHAPAPEGTERMREALKIAADRLEEDGCDCGTDEPGSCALCVVRAALGNDAEGSCAK